MVTLHVSTAEAMQILVAYHELLNQYETHWAKNPTEDHTQEREWYNETLKNIAEPVSQAIFKDENIRNYLASEQTEDGQVITVESVIQFERTL